jgi:hypothetical protein
LVGRNGPPRNLRGAEQVTKEELAALDQAATQGVWSAEIEAETEPGEIANVYICHPETVCDVTVVATMGKSSSNSEYQRRKDAALIVALVNAYRTGKLVFVEEQSK